MQKAGESIYYEYIVYVEYICIIICIYINIFPKLGEKYIYIKGSIVICLYFIIM